MTDSAEYHRLNLLKAQAQQMGENTDTRALRFVCAAIVHEVCQMQRVLRWKQRKLTQTHVSQEVEA